MKALKLLVAVVGISLLFASCKSNMDLTKRHYTKGYYFHKNSSIEQPAIKEEVALKTKRSTVNDIPMKEVALTKNKDEELKGSLKENNLTLGFSKTKSGKNEVSKNTGVSKQLKNKKAFSAIQQKGKTSKPAAGGLSADGKLIVCIILAIILPPLGMYIWDKNTDIWFIVDLILFLFVFSWFLWGAFGFVGLAAIVIALLRVLGLL